MFHPKRDPLTRPSATTLSPIRVDSPLPSAIGARITSSPQAKPHQRRKNVAHGESRGMTVQRKHAEPRSGDRRSTVIRPALSPLPGLYQEHWPCLFPTAFAVGHIFALLSKMAERCGSAAPLCGRAPPFRAETAPFLSSSPCRRLSLRHGEDEVGCLRRVPGRRSQPAEQAAKPQIARPVLLFWTRVTFLRPLRRAPEPHRDRSSALSHVILDNVPLPLGGEGGPQPAVSSAGAGRVRGFLPTDPMSTIR